MLLIVVVYTWRLRRRWSQFQADEKEDSVAAWYSSLLAGQSAEHFAARNRSAHSTEVTRWTSCCFDALVLLCFVQISLQLAKFLHYGSSLPRWLVKPVKCLSVHLSVHPFVRGQHFISVSKHVSDSSKRRFFAKILHLLPLRRYCVHSVTHWSKNGFSPLAAKLLIGSKKVRGCKNDTHLLYHRAKYGWDSSSCAGCRRKKVWCFCLFFVMLWNDEVCGNGNAMKKCNFQNNYGVTAQRKVCSCAHIFNFFCGPQNFPLGANLYKKITIFLWFFFGGPHFSSHSGEIWHEGANLGVPPSCQIW